jgi:16S rRNA (guanine966-N2)-methyltransferase
MLASFVSPAPGEAPLVGKSCLDLFAGTGALGIEALSRGAANCVFVEINPAAATALNENLNAIVYGGSTRREDSSAVADTGSVRVVRSDWRIALRRLGGRVIDEPSRRIDIAFVDPPYGADYYDEVMKTFLDYDIISDGGIVALERPSRGKNIREGGTRRARGGADGVNSIEAPSSAGRYEGFSLMRERRYGKTAIEFYGRIDS